MSDSTNYNACLRCGKVNGYSHAGLTSPYCNLLCQLQMAKVGPVSSEEWEKNFNDSVAKFKEAQARRFAEARKATKGKP